LLISRRWVILYPLEQTVRPVASLIAGLEVTGNVGERKEFRDEKVGIVAESEPVGLRVWTDGAAFHGL
jgi:hypothetical protein